MTAHPITDPVAARAFTLGGNATLTLVSEKTGTRYTYRVRRPNEDAPFFVSVMYGPDNEGDYAFVGTIFGGGDYRHGRRSRVPEHDARNVAFRYFWQHLRAGRIAPKLVVWHEGRCGRCGRKLTVPESIESGFGPECSGRRAASSGGTTSLLDHLREEDPGVSAAYGLA